jgi:hypothetical protein
MRTPQRGARVESVLELAMPAVSVYPDSDKIAVWPGEESDELIFKRGSAGAVVGRRGRMGESGLTNSSGGGAAARGQSGYPLS